MNWKNHAQWHALLKEWQANWRIRAAVQCAVLLVLFYLVQWLHSGLVNLQQEQSQSAETLQRLKAVVAETAWPERAAQSMDLLKRAESELWEAQSAGLAQAKLQSTLATMVADAGLSLEIRTDGAAHSPDTAFVRVPATLTGLVQKTKLMQLLAQLESYPQLIVIQRLDAASLSDSEGRVYLTLDAWFLPFTKEQE